MLWVFIALVVMIVSLVVPFLQQIMETVKNSMYVPPSNAIFDQAMPEEILEQIFSCMDPLTLQQAHNVSKYWRYNASKNRIKTVVVERYFNVVKNSEDIQKMVERNGEGMFLQYPAKYSVDLRLRDMALAEKRGRTLLELELEGSSFHEVVRILSDLPKNQYLIKTKAKASALNTFSVGWQTIHVQNFEQIKPLVTLADQQNADKNIRYEVMLELEDYLKSESMRVNAAVFVMFRNLTQPKKVFGFITLDESFVKTMIFLLLPLIVHDAIYSDFMKYLKIWFGPCAFAVLNFIITQENWQILSYAPVTNSRPLYKKLVISTSILATVGFGLFYPYSSTHFAFVGLFIGAFGYLFTLHDHVVIEETTFKPKNNEKLKLFIVCMALVLLSNDWSVVIRSILDGSIFLTLFWNTVHFLVFLLYPIWNNVMSCIVWDREKIFRWRHFITWESEVVKLMASFYGAVVFITLYAPHWQGNY